MEDLYKVDLSGIPVETPCAGNDGNNGESCVGMQRFPGGVALSDTKNPEAGTLRFTDSEVQAFVKHVTE